MKDDQKTAMVDDHPGDARCDYRLLDARHTPGGRPCHPEGPADRGQTVFLNRGRVARRDHVATDPRLPARRHRSQAPLRLVRRGLVFASLPASPFSPAPFQWLPSPWPDELFSLIARLGFLRLFGRESVGSQFRQSPVARREQTFCHTASAGLICYYGSFNFHYLFVSHYGELGRHLQLRARSGASGFLLPGPSLTLTFFNTRKGSAAWDWPERLCVSLVGKPRLHR